MLSVEEMKEKVDKAKELNAEIVDAYNEMNEALNNVLLRIEDIKKNPNGGSGPYIDGIKAVERVIKKEFHIETIPPNSNNMIEKSHVTEEDATVTKKVIDDDYGKFDFI